MISWEVTAHDVLQLLVWGVNPETPHHGLYRLRKEFPVAIQFLLHCSA